MAVQQLFSLRDKFVLYFTIIGLIILMSIGFLSYYTSKDAILKRTFDQLTSLRIEKKKQLKSFFYHQDIAIKEIANYLNYQLKNKVILTDTIFIKKNNPSISPVLKYITVFENIWILNPTTNKHIELKYNTKSNTNHIKLIKKACEKAKNLHESSHTTEPVYLDFISPPTGNISEFYISQKLENTGLILLANIKVSNFIEIMYEVNPENGLGKSGETYLVGEDFLMRSASRFQNNSILSTKVNTKAALNALKGETGTQIVNDYRNIPVLSSFEPLKIRNLHWSILSEMDVKEVMTPVYSLRNKLLLISAIIASLIFILAVIISQSILKPITKLKSAFLDITKGNLDVNISSFSNDELGVLVQSFNQMAQELKLKNAELESERLKSLGLFLDGQEMERRRIAREIHDSLGQLLVVLKMRVERLSCENINQNEHKVILADLINETIIEARRISNDLSSSVLHELGLQNAIKGLLNSLTELNQIKSEIHFEGDFTQIAEFQASYIYRIAQEAINNIVKHSNASFVIFSLHSRSNWIELQISDNGTGFKNTVQPNGNGLINMKDRVKILGGKIQIDSEIQKGTKISITIPIISHD